MSSVRSNRTHKNFEILKKFDSVRSKKFELIRFGSIFQESSRVSLYRYDKFKIEISLELKYLIELFFDNFIPLVAFFIKKKNFKKLKNK